MPAALCFTLLPVLQLAEHARAAPHHAEPVADEPASPAPQLVVDRGICLRSNGHPAPPSATGAVFADGYPAGTPWLDLVHATRSERPFSVGLPLTGQHRFIDSLRDAAHRGFTTVTVHLRGGTVRIGVRRDPTPCQPATTP